MRKPGRWIAFCTALALPCVTVAVGFSSAAAARSPAASPRPNIVFILTDDQRYDTVTPQFMPNVWSQLVEHGLYFKNGFVTRSECCPSRASILTGQYAHNHGVLTNATTGEYAHGAFPAFKDKSSVATWLQSAGYRTGLVGKYFNFYGSCSPWLCPDITDPRKYSKTYVPPGWDTFRAITNGGQAMTYFDSLNVDGKVVDYPKYTGIPRDRMYHPENYMTTVLENHALDFIGKSATDSRPFFLYFAPNSPHALYLPADQDQSAFSGLSPFRPPSFNEADMSDKPDWLRSAWLNVGQVDKIRQLQLQTNLAVDRAVGDIVEKLRRLGKLDNTYIFFTSDNGYMWGEHRLSEGKLVAYEESVRVPLVVRGPGVRQGESSALAANIDFAPTFAELARATPTLAVDGRSLTPIFSGLPTVWRSDLLLEHWAEPLSPPSFKALRTTHYKYVEYDSPTAAIKRELYDLRVDPYEMRNLVADNSAPPDLVQRLSARVSQLAKCAGQSCRAEAP